MAGITFLHPSYLLVSLVAPVLVFLWHRRQPTLGHSSLRLHRNINERSILRVLPPLFFILAATSSAAALAWPHADQKLPARTINARYVLFAVDISQNMNETYADTETFGGYGNYGSSGSGSGLTGGTAPAQGCGTISDWGTRKLDVMAHAVCVVSDGLAGNRFAVVTFDGAAYVDLPFVSDEQIVERKARDLNQYLGDSNSNFDGPYAASQEGPGVFQVALDLINKASLSKTRVVVMITDGDGSIDSGRRAQLTAYAKQLDVHLYLLGVGFDSAADDPPSNDVNAMTLALGGPVMDAAKSGDLSKLIAEIKQLPASPIPLDEKTTQHDIYQEFLLAAVLLWLAFLGTNAFVGRTQ